MATIRDVAKMCGVSTATVSNVLNAHSARVSDDTRRKVLRAVRTLRYRPTPLQKSQKTILTHNLALVCGDLSASPIVSNHYLGRVFDGVLEAAAFQSWSVTIFVERMWSDTGCAVRRSYDGRCDGVIALSPKRDSALVPDLVERGVPVVSVGTTVELPGVSTVDIDNQEAGFELTNYLIELGHTKIAFLGPAWDVASSLERCLGYRRAMQRADLSPQISVYLSISSSLAEGYSDCMGSEWPGIHLISGPADDLARAAFAFNASAPTAIVCWNEDYARVVCSTLEDLGLEVPDDVSVASFDDAEQDPYAKLHFTTMRQPFHRIGVRAVEILISRILNPDVPDQSVRFKAELVARGTTGPSHRCVASKNRQVCTQAISTNGGNS